MSPQEDQLVIALEKEKDIGVVIAEVRAVAAAMGFETLAIAEIALGVSEICQNAIRHAEKGQAVIRTRNADKILQIQISDKGSGILNILQAMEDGFSTISNSLGIGLQVAKRTMDKFSIESQEAQGTTVVLEKHLPLVDGFMTHGVVSLAEEGQQYNGDSYLVRAFGGDSVLCAVVDGLGQGHTAHVMAEEVKEVLIANFDVPLAELILLCDQQLQDRYEGGVAMSLALIEKEMLSYVGIGDTHAYLQQNTGLRPLISFDGRVGARQLRSFKVSQYALQADDILIMCTDGMTTRVAVEASDLNYSAQNMANTLFNKYHRAYGDVTVLVVKYQPTYR